MIRTELLFIPLSAIYTCQWARPFGRRGQEAAVPSVASVRTRWSVGRGGGSRRRVRTGTVTRWAVSVHPQVITYMCIVTLPLEHLNVARIK